MNNNKVLSILIIGYHREIVNKIIDWDEMGIVSLIGVLAPIDNSIIYLDVPLIHKEKLEQIENQEINIILMTNKQIVDDQFVSRLKQPDTIMIDLDTFWILNRMVDYNIKIHNLSTDQKLFQTILMYSHEGIQFVDADGIIRYVNPSFSRITNITPEERLGKKIEEVSPEGALNRALKTRTPVIGYKATGQGSNVETISNAAPIFVDGNFVGAVTTFQDITEIKYLTHKLMEHEQDLSNEKTGRSKSNESKYSLMDIIGNSEAMVNTKELAKKASRTRSTVLINSESGTGKELFAHAIHSESEFREKPFVVVNCAAIPEALLESELFGYEKGSFTNATKQKIGKIELANEGTLFLDEIGDMSPPLQSKLLRVLQYKEFERVGGLITINVNLRIIAATHCDLPKLVAEGKFREDLYYRLNVIHIQIPPLRYRKEDIPLLVKVLMKRIAKRINLHPMELTNKGVAILSDYSWPGNIRELENFLERLMNESTSSVIPDSLVVQHIQKLVGANPNTNQKKENQSALPAPPTMPLRAMEKKYIKRALDYFGNTLDGKKKAALSLGISISTLYNKIRTYNLE